MTTSTRTYTTLRDSIAVRGARGAEATAGRLVSGLAACPPVASCAWTGMQGRGTGCPVALAGPPFGAGQMAWQGTRLRDRRVAHGMAPGASGKGPPCRRSLHGAAPARERGGRSSGCRGRNGLARSERRGAAPCERGGALLPGLTGQRGAIVTRPGNPTPSGAELARAHRTRRCGSDCSHLQIGGSGASGRRSDMRTRKSRQAKRA